MIHEGEKHDGGVSLPEDIVFNVLTRVPAKALCRFRCVCKGWRAHICDPAFVAAQRSRSGLHLLCLFITGRTQRVQVMDMDGNIFRVFQVVDMDEGDVFGVLKQATTQLNNVIVHGQCIGVNPMIIAPGAGRACTVDVGRAAPCGDLLTFGCVALSGAFKILYVKETLPSQICKVASIVDGGVESLRWRQRSVPPFTTSWWPERRVTVNGVVYCLPPPFHECGAASSGSHLIAAFDLESEEWKIIVGPALGIQEDTLYAKLTELKGTLGLVQALCQNNYDDRSYDIVIWLLIDFKKSVWIKEYTIQMPGTWRLTKLLGSLDDGTILLLVREREKQSRVCRLSICPLFYNLRIKTFTKFVDIVKGFGDIMVLYTGNLLS